MSPTSRCFPSTPEPFVSPGPNGPATGGHLDVIVPAPSPPSANKEKIHIVNEIYLIPMKIF